MAERLQIMGDDVVLEITESEAVKRRLSEKTLLRRKHYLEQSIAKFSAALEATVAKLAQITQAKDGQRS